MQQDQNPVLTGDIQKQIVLLTLPLIAAELLQQLYNTADALIIGRFLGNEAFAATGISGAIMNLFIFILSGFCVGVSMIFSRKYGAGDWAEFRKVTFTAISFGCLFTVVLSMLCILLVDPALRLVDTPPELLGYCKKYLAIILGGLFATYFNNLFTSILRAVGATKLALLFLTVSIVSNIVLDLLFVAALPFGIAGAAAATVAAQATSAVSCFCYLKRKFPHLLCRREDAGIYQPLIKQIFSYGTSSALHMSSLYIGKLMVQRIVNPCGTAVIAAFTATTRIEAFINASGNGFSQAESIFVAQNLAAGQRDRVQKAIQISFKLMIALGLVFSVVMYFVSPYALRLFMDASETESLAVGTAYLKIIFFFYVISYTDYCFVGAARGHGRMTVPFIGTTLQLLVRVVFAAFTIQRLGLSAVAWATGIGWFCLLIYHYTQFRQYTAPSESD